MPYSNIYEIIKLKKDAENFGDKRNTVKKFSDGSELITEHGRKSENDFKIIHKSKTGKEKLYKHEEIFDKVNNSSNKDKLLEDINLIFNGLPPSKNYVANIDDEVSLEFFKWVFIQEDINYPKGKGRKLTLDALNYYIDNN